MKSTEVLTHNSPLASYTFIAHKIITAASTHMQQMDHKFWLAKYNGLANSEEQRKTIDIYQAHKWGNEDESDQRKKTIDKALENEQESAWHRETNAACKACKRALESEHESDQHDAPIATYATPIT